MSSDDTGFNTDSADAVPFSCMTLFADLPICALHRKTKISVFWQAVKDRVVPGVPLPPILVLCHDQGVDLACVFSTVRILLVRPATGQLLGTTKRRFLISLPTEDPGISSPPVQQQQQLLVPTPTASVLTRPAGGCLGDVTNNASARGHMASGKHKGPAGAASSPSSQGSYALSASTTVSTSSAAASSSGRRQFVFDDIKVTTAGEHFLCAEVSVAGEYIPFVQPLVYSIPPFRVIDPAVG
jgi:hypothetical protein